MWGGWGFSFTAVLSTEFHSVGSAPSISSAVGGRRGGLALPAQTARPNMGAKVRLFIESQKQTSQKKKQNKPPFWKGLA